MNPIDHSLLSAWKNKFFHFNNVNTSRVEEAYSTLKKYLKVSTMDLWEVCNKIELGLLTSVAELRAAISGCVIKVWNDQMDNCFAGVVQIVSRYALVKVHEQMLLLDDPTLCRLDCFESFSTILWLPCVHNIASRKLSYGVLHIGDFHARWNLRRV